MNTIIEKKIQQVVDTDGLTWDAACDNVANAFRSEGLQASADAALKWKGRKP